MVESQVLEFKRIYSDGVRKTVIAFANTDGGKLMIGVEDDGEIVGLENAHEEMLQISNSLRGTIKPDVMMLVSMLLEEIDGKYIIIIEVKKGLAAPYYLGNKGIRPEGVFVRQGASTVSASEAAILKMIRETSGNRYEVTRAVNQEITFENLGAHFARKNLKFEAIQYKTLGLVDNENQFTNLGFLLSDECDRSIKFAVYQGSAKRIFKYRREFTGSLLKQLEDVFLLIDKYNATASYVDGLYRNDIRDYPSEAIREALLNAIVHREYELSASTLISIFDDRLEILSAGSLMKGVTLSDIMLGLSSLRNPNLANIFYRLELIEAYGTGMQKIMEEYGDYAFKPIVEFSDNAFKITLPNINYYDTFANKPIEQTDEKNLNNELSEREETIVKLLQKQGSVRRKDIEILLAVSQATAITILRNMVTKRIIEKQGKGKNLKYTLKV